MGFRRLWKFEWIFYLYVDYSLVRVLFLGRSRGRRGSVIFLEVRKLVLDLGFRILGFVFGDVNLRGVGIFFFYVEIGILKCFFV